MKILNIHIDNFGKLSDVDIDFSNNPEIIFEDNGWGKSTLATFIKVMFYGFEGESKKRLIDKEREKYRPWNKGIYGGSILLAIGDKEYELTRHFGSKEKDDTGSLVDITTNLETKDYDYTKLGEQIFSIDMDAFLRTVYLGQGNIAVHVSSEGIGDSIAAKISNLAEATDDVNNFDRVMKEFKERMNGLKSGSKFGEINKLNSQKTELEANVRQAEVVDKGIDELNEKLRSDENRLGALDEVRDKLEKEWVAAGEIGRYAEWKKNHDALVEDNDKLKEQFAEARKAMQETDSSVKVFDEDEIKHQLSNLDRFEECKELEKELETKIDNLQYRYDTEVRIAEEKRQREFEEASANRIKTIEAEQRQQRNKRMIGIGLGAVLLLLAFALFLYSKAILAVLVGFVGVAIIDVTAINTKKKLYEKDKIAMEPIETYFVNKSQMESDLNKLKDEKLKASHDAREAESFVRQFFELMEIDYSARSARQELISMKDNQKNQLNLHEERKKHLDAAKKAYENSCEKLEASKNSPSAKVPEHLEDIRSLEEISEERKIVDEELEQVRKNISTYKGYLQEKKELRDSISEDEEQLDIIKEKLAEYEHRYGIIQKTADYMSKAKEKLNSLYMNPIAEAYKRYYGYVAEDIDDYDIDANINITRKELGEKRRADNLSCGYRDLVDIALRMALIDVMYDEEKPFIILDDPFVNLDTEKLGKAKEMLNKLASDYQVIYFTCHESRA